MRSKWGRRDSSSHLHDDQRVLRRCPKSVMLPVTPQPRCSVAAMRFKRCSGSMFVSRCVVVVSGSPEDRTQRDPRIRRIWATSPRLPFVIQKVGHLGVEPRPSCSQSRRASICTCIRCCLLCSPRTIPSAHIFLVSGPGGARILVCGSSDRR